MPSANMNFNFFKCVCSLRAEQWYSNELFHYADQEKTNLDLEKKANRMDIRMHEDDKSLKLPHINSYKKTDNE